MYPRRDKRSGHYGYWASNGWAVPPKFSYAAPFFSGYARVKLIDGQVALLTKDGTLLLLEELCGGRPICRDESVTFAGFMDWDTRPTRYAGVCTVGNGTREWCLLDTSLAYRPLPADVFSDASVVGVYGHHLIFLAESDRHSEVTCGLFNLDKDRLELPCDYSLIYPSREGLWVISRVVEDPRQTPRFAFYDATARELIQGWFFGALPFSCGFGAISEQDGPMYFVDRILQPVFDDTFDDVRGFNYGLAAVYKGANAGYIDTTGRIRLLLPYDELQAFNESGFAIAIRHDKEQGYDIIDRNGDAQVTDLEVADFWDGDFPFFEVSKGGKEHVLDMNLNEVF